jgi:hypothetical protein
MIPVGLIRAACALTLGIVLMEAVSETARILGLGFP